MDSYFWHVDEAFIALVDEPLFLLGGVFTLLLCITIGLVIHAKGGGDDA